jgi:hypothetical protein
MEQLVIQKLPTAAVLCLIVSLSGCGSNSNWPIAGSVLRNAVFGEPDTFISRESLSKIPYAMITARVGKRPAAILVLAHSDGSTRHWMASNEVSIVTHNGRMVQTVGFPRDLRRTDLFDADPLSSAPHLLREPVSYQRTQYYRQGDPGSDSAVSLNCTLEAIRPVDIEIAEVRLHTILMEENCRSDTGGSASKQTSLFWVDPYDGFTWQSRQKITEGYPPLTISVLKPEG